MATYTGADKAIDYLFTASGNTADEYDNAATYAVGDFAIYEGVLYICTSAVSVPEDFDSAKWQQTKVTDNLGGGGGGGTTVIANPAGAATDTLNKLQVGQTIYAIPSGGSVHTYSQTEQIVGTWIDGKTIYENTYHADVSSSTSGSVQLPNNTDKVIRIEGFVVQITTDNEVMVNFCNDSTDKANVYYRLSDKTVQIRTGTSYGKGQYYLTVQYTKTV